MENAYQPSMSRGRRKRGRRSPVRSVTPTPLLPIKKEEIFTPAPLQRRRASTSSTRESRHPTPSKSDIRKAVSSSRRRRATYSGDSENRRPKSRCRRRVEAMARRVSEMEHHFKIMEEQGREMERQGEYMENQARVIERYAADMERHATNIERQAVAIECQGAHMERYAKHIERDTRHMARHAKHLEREARNMERQAVQVSREASEIERQADSIERMSKHGHTSVETEMAHAAPLFLNEARVTELLEGQWLPLIDAMHQALLTVVSNNTMQPPRTVTAIKDRGFLLSMPGFVDLANSAQEGDSVLVTKLVTSFEGNSRRQPPMPSVMATILLFDVTTGSLSTIMEATEITARRTAATSVAATNILYHQRHSKPREAPFILGIFGAGVQGRSHALAFHAAYPNISEIRIWNHRKPKAEFLVAELQTLGINQAKVADTVQECAEEADVLVTATNADVPFLFSDWVKNGTHINAIRVTAMELDEGLYQRAKIYLDDESERKGLQNLEALGASLIALVGAVVLQPDLQAGKDDVTIFQSAGMAVEDALAAQLVYKRYLLSIS